MKVMKKGIMKVTHFEENHRKRNKNTELLRTTFLFCLLALILQGPPSAEHKLWQIKRRNNYPSPSLFKAFLRGAVPKTNISCKFFTHRKLYYRALRESQSLQRREINRKHLCGMISLWASHFLCYFTSLSFQVQMSSIRIQSETLSLSYACFYSPES